MGEPGAKNGEKKLRSGLSHSDEWACSVTRNRTADALEAAARAPGAPQGAVADAATLAAALRSRDSAKLRKRHMLALVRAWQPFTAKEHVNTLAPTADGKLWAVLHNLGEVSGGAGQ